MINSSCYDQAWFRQATPIDNTDESESVFKMYSKTRTSPVQVYLFFTVHFIIYRYDLLQTVQLNCYNILIPWRTIV